ARDAKVLGETLNWEQRGWPAWELYRPIAAAALAADLALVAGDVARQNRMALSKAPAFAAFTGKAGILIDLPAPALAGVKSAIAEGHCNMLPDRALAPMANIQRARDVSIAKAMLDARRSAQSDGAVLIAGAGHARKDWGVGYLLALNAPDAKVVSLAMLEVSEDGTDAAEYIQRGDDLPAPFDFALFTPAGDVTDHCAAFAKAMQARGSKAKE
ncbi:MAG: ChaN family lipoprotein, partial [Pseudomonadota bacterium]